MKTREEKIKFLKDLQAGKVSVESAKPKLLSLVFNKTDITKVEAYLIGGVKVTHEQWCEEMQKQKTNLHEVCAPLTTNILECEVPDRLESIKQFWIQRQNEE